MCISPMTCRQVCIEDLHTNSNIHNAEMHYWGYEFIELHCKLKKELLLLLLCTSSATAEKLGCAVPLSSHFYQPFFPNKCYSAATAETPERVARTRDWSLRTADFCAGWCRVQGIGPQGMHRHPQKIIWAGSGMNSSSSCSSPVAMGCYLKASWISWGLGGTVL